LPTRYSSATTPPTAPTSTRAFWILSRSTFALTKFLALQQHTSSRTAPAHISAQFRPRAAFSSWNHLRWSDVHQPSSAARLLQTSTSPLKPNTSARTPPIATTTSRYQRLPSWSSAAQIAPSTLIRDIAQKAAPRPSTSCRLNSLLKSKSAQIRALTSRKS